MGPEFGDVDLDGHVDLLVPDMGYSCLYRNTGKGYFEDHSARAGLAATCGQYTSWSGNLFDFDHDGDLDIFISNGDSNHLEPEEDVLFLNNGNMRFADVSENCGDAMRRKFVSRGSATGDFDNDGDLDILVVNLNARPRLLRNDGGNRRHWLMIRTVGTTDNRDGIGTRIRVTAGEVTQTRTVRSASGYLSQSDPRIHFGLGDAVVADEIELRWPDGALQLLADIDADQVLVVTQPQGASGR
jgi:hypothetical protein